MHFSSPRGTPPPAYDDDAVNADDSKDGLPRWIPSERRLVFPNSYRMQGNFHDRGSILHTKTASDAKAILRDGAKYQDWYVRDTPYTYTTDGWGGSPDTWGRMQHDDDNYWYVNGRHLRDGTLISGLRSSEVPKGV